MSRLFTIACVLGIFTSCYVQDSNEKERQELVDEFNLDCDAMPEVCQFSEEYSSCAEYPSADDVCRWHQCLEFEGQRSRWIGRRECLRDVCGIPFSEACVNQYQVLQLDCYENSCKTELDALACNSLAEEARNVCG